MLLPYSYRRLCYREESNESIALYNFKVFSCNNEESEDGNGNEWREILGG